MKPTTLSLCISVLFAVLSSSFAFTQNISKEATIADLQYLQAKIKTYQPALDEYAPEFDLQSEMIIESIAADSLSFFEYNQLVSKVCVGAKEGHFSVGTWTDTVRKGIPENTYRYLPIDVVVLNNKVYLERDYSNEQSLTVGSEIKQINNKPIAHALQEMLVCMPSDGAIMTNVLNELNYAFPYNYHFFIEQADNFILELEKPNGDRHIASIKALSKKEQSTNFRKYIHPNKPTDKSKSNPVYSIAQNTDHTLLTLRSFNNTKLNKQEIKPRKLYRAIFDTLAQNETQNLIIDLRDNSGGLFSMASELVPYLTNGASGNRVARVSTSWKGKKKKYTFRKRVKNSYDGNVYVLINGGTFSSASTLARYLKEETDAILIGEETGSRYEAFAAGSKQYIHLPNSGIRVGIPRYLIEFGDGVKQTTSDRGVLPNHTVIYTIDDVLQQRDLHLKKALELIRNN
ncbi:MAG: S41 family peptidase [Crocinitomicaceae bacterium]